MLDNKERQKLEPKQIIVIRKDLNMPSGKLASQVSHASLGCILNLTKKQINEKDDGSKEYTISLELSENNPKEKAVTEWLFKRFTKVILYVKSEQKLIEVFEKAKAKGLNTVMIEDKGFTVFNGVETKTCIGIGPCYIDDLIGVTDKLQLLKT